jgi:transposase InsO family protein
MVEEEMNASACLLPTAAVSAHELTPSAMAAARSPATGNDLAAATASASDHLQRLQEIIQVHAAAERPMTRREARAAQEPRRRLEQDVRQSAVDFYHRSADSGGSLVETAGRLHLLPRTLRQWDYVCRADQGQVALLGRPLHAAAPGKRTAILDFLAVHGPALGVPRLRQQFPQLPRAELEELLGGYRQAWRQQHQQVVRVLHWQVPGRVWAVDFAEPSLLGAPWSLPPIDGRYPYLLAVRDLASGYQLVWLPVAETTAAQVQEVLARLFAVHGAPLVLKADNGGPFRAEDTKAFLEAAGVLALFSPPACPGYNGSIEASICSLKKRTQEQAQRRHSAGLWTGADVEAARQEANASHPPRLNGRTPTDVWERRTAIGVGERFRFALSVEGHRDTVRQDLGIEPKEYLDHWHQGKVDRQALQRALVEHDYLLFTRRRIALRIRS